jgi:hypothetical protein
VALLVHRVAKVKTAKKRVWRELRGSRELPASVGLRRREGEELSGTAMLVSPDPTVEGLEHGRLRYARAVAAARRDDREALSFATALACFL